MHVFSLVEEFVVCSVCVRHGACRPWDPWWLRLSPCPREAPVQTGKETFKLQGEESPHTGTLSAVKNGRGQVTPQFGGVFWKRDLSGGREKQREIHTRRQGGLREHAVFTSWMWLTVVYTQTGFRYLRFIRSGPVFFILNPFFWNVFFSSWRQQLLCRQNQKFFLRVRLPFFFFSSFELLILYWKFPGGSDSNKSAYNAGDPSSIHGSGRSPGGGHGNPFQYSCLGNVMDQGVWWATVHGITKSQAPFSD